MAWQVEVTDEFKTWWNGLSGAEQISVATGIELLVENGPNLSFPHSSKVNGSRHSAMRELRVQHQGRPCRVLYIFDPRRVAILLLGGDKTGDDRWYEKNVPQADRVYDECLQEIQKEQDDAQTD
ncbi:MAG: type II toxin-antitoxin system RelE/ParE family toxin [Bryobacteraceae bacterium]